MPSFVRRCRGLSECHLDTDRFYDAPSTADIIRAIDPSQLSTLHVGAFGEELETQGLEVKLDQFVNIDTLTLPALACTTALVKFLPTLPKLKSLEFLPRDIPSYSHIHAILHSSTRSPSLERLTLGMPIEFLIGTERVRFENLADELSLDMDEAYRFSSLCSGWSKEKAEEIVELAKWEKIELNDQFEIAIEMTRRFEEKEADFRTFRVR